MSINSCLCSRLVSIHILIFSIAGLSRPQSRTYAVSLASPILCYHMQTVTRLTWNVLHHVMNVKFCIVRKAARTRHFHCTIGLCVMTLLMISTPLGYFWRSGSKFLLLFICFFFTYFNLFCFIIKTWQSFVPYCMDVFFSM